MRIAVIVPAFNVAAFLQQAIQSVLDQSHADWFTVIIDDGSTDDTVAVVSRFLSDHIHLIQQDNTGVSVARNRGVRFAEPRKPDAYLFLDGDDWLSPDAMSRLADTLDAAPWAAAACGRYARVARSGVSRLSGAAPDGCIIERLVTQNLFANGGHLLIRQEAIEAAGGFRDDLSYGEDWEYWTRLASQGEFAAVRSRTPVLFVRERPGSATLLNATDPVASRPAMEAIHRNPAIADRLGSARMAHLRHRAEAEMAWALGRELVRHGRRRDGLLWLARSFWRAPSLRRLMLIGLSWPGFGPFRPYCVDA